MIHIGNIPHILQNGITGKNSPNANPDFIAIGDTSLIETRSSKKVRVNNGDIYNVDALEITLGDFIPFYFGIKMPMLYVIQNGGNFVKKATKPEHIIYLVCSLSKITAENSDYYFSDGHATDNFTTFYDSRKTKELPILLNWRGIKAGYWAGNDNLTLKRKKQAEFLISNDLSPDCIIGFVCYNELAKESLIAMEVDSNIIKVYPQAYY